MNAKLFGLGFITLTLALICGYLSFQLLAQENRIQDLEAQLATVEKPAPQLDLDSMISSTKGITLSSRAKTRKLKITCPACKGEGKHIIGYPGQLDPEVYGCSICRGKGHHVITVHANEERCSSCQGMGSIGRKKRDGMKRIEMWTARLCPTCNSTGKTKKF